MLSRRSKPNSKNSKANSTTIESCRPWSNKLPESLLRRRDGLSNRSLLGSLQCGRADGGKLEKIPDGSGVATVITHRLQASHSHRALLECDCDRPFATSRAFCADRPESEPSSRGTGLRFHTWLRCSGLEALRGFPGAMYPEASARSDDTRPTRRLAPQAI
jgi:hypothetical protein